MSKGTIINEFGEVIENATYYTEEEINGIKRYKENKAKSDMIPNRNKTYFKRFITEFNKIEDLDEQSATRLMYLATYTSYDNNILKFDNGKLITNKHFGELLNLKEAMCRRFISEMINKGYLIELDDGFQINTDVVHRGKDSERKLAENERYTKIYIQAMRKMYLSVNPRQHKLLGYIFQTLPYVNIYHNILCYNPYEKNLDRIEYIDMVGICSHIGLSPTQVTRFRKNTEKVLFEFMGIEQHFMCYLLAADEEKNQGRIIVNPSIMYSSDEINRQDVLNIFYKNDKKLKSKSRQELIPKKKD